VNRWDRLRDLGRWNKSPHSRLNTWPSEHDMQLAELVRHHDDHRSIGLVTCPNCRVDMPRVGLKDTESEKNLREATYHWSEVRDRNTAVDRAIEASEASHSSQTYFSDRPRRAHRKRTTDGS
jgi:hypothetical protein